MNATKFVYLLALLAFGLNFVVGITTADAQKCHALLVIMDDDPSIGDNVEVDRKRVNQLLREVQNRTCAVEVTTLLSSRNTATRGGILRWVQNIDVMAEDIVFIYYAGHGGMNKRGKTFLATEQQWIFRSELVDAIERVGAHRLTILITDCCSSLVQSDIEPTLQRSRTLTRLTDRVLRDLFLEHKGFLHVTAATEGQYGWSNRATGGWFTKNFIQALDSDPDQNQDSFLSWEEVFVKARANTEKTFSQTTFTLEQQARMRQLGITSQTPKAYSLPTPLGGSVLKRVDRKTVNYIFLAIVLSIFGISNLISRGLKKRYVSKARLRSHRNRVFMILGIIALVWIQIQFNIPAAKWVFIGSGVLFIIGWILNKSDRSI